MKGIILAGGLGTRLLPLTAATNKHLLRVYDRPMIYYPIQTLVKAGIREIMIVTGGNFGGQVFSTLKGGKEHDIRSLYFAWQEQEGGIAEALALTEQFVGSDNVCVILGDNCTDADISQEVSNFKGGAHLFLKKVPDPERFGVPSFNSANEITGIEEKPKKPASDFAVTGLYLYDSNVFYAIKTLERSPRGELEITGVNNWYLRNSLLSNSQLEGFWSDAGTPESIHEVELHWAAKARGAERG